MINLKNYTTTSTVFIPYSVEREQAIKEKRPKVMYKDGGNLNVILSKEVDIKEIKSELLNL